ncbi:hypothetical protein ACO0R3_003321 [Hanseniaspora guilliermondii]
MLSNTFREALLCEQTEDVDQIKELLLENDSNFKQLEAIGFMARHLSVDSLSTGPGGKLLIKLLFNKDKDSMSSFNLKVGDIVILSKGSSNLKTCLSKLEIQGHVYRQSKDYITLIVDQDLDFVSELSDNNGFYFLIKTINEITYRKMFRTIDKLKMIEESEENHSLLIDVLLNRIDKDTLKSQLNYSSHHDKDISFFNSSLNDSQKNAVNFALNNPISIIHGPFACGKTSTIVEILEQINNSPEHKGKVMVCGPSNVSVDTILEKVSKNGNIKHGQLIRIGNPTRMHGNFSHSLDNMVNNGEEGTICKDIKSEINTLLRQSTKDNNKTRKKTPKPALRGKAKWNEIKLLRKDLSKREGRLVKDIVKNSKFIFATLHGSSNKQVLTLYDDECNVENGVETLIIDEVSQALEPQCWIPILDHMKYLKRIIFAGDNKQLPPTIKTLPSQSSANNKTFKALNTTIFDRLESIYDKAFISFLNTQYRMNERIMEFPSRQMYDGQVVSGDTNRHILLSDLCDDEISIESDEILNEPLLWYDTQCDLSFMEDQKIDGNNPKKNDIFNSKSNINEVCIALKHIERLIDVLHLKEEHIGIITPYQAQVQQMRFHINEKFPSIEIHTVDGFQGNEKECIILSLVRFNENNELGFVKDERRLNVAITRAKRQLCVIGNIETFSISKESNNFLKNWCAYIDAEAIIEYPEL